MSTNRRNFLKKAAITAPGIALIGTAQGMHGAVSYNEPEEVIADHNHDNGWINARDCGASGSTFRTNAITKAGSKQITVADVSDFKVGQGIMVSKCNIRYESVRMWSVGIPYASLIMRKPENSFEMRGYDGFQEAG